MANEQFFANGPTTTLSTAIADYLQTTIHVDNAANFPGVGDFTIKVDNELLLVTGVSGTAWTVARGQESTQAIGHAAGAIVSMPLTQYGLDNLVSVFKGGNLVGKARRINLVDSATATWTVTPDPVNQRLDITPAVVSAPGGGGGGSPYQRSPSAVPKQADFNALYNATGQTYLYDHASGLGMYDVAHNSQNMRMLISKTPVPALPWCVTARLDGYADQSGNEYGVFVMDGATRNWMALSFNNTKIRQVQGTDATGAVTAGTELVPLPFATDTKWVRITEHDSQRRWQVSKDGYNWINIAAGWDYFMSFCQTPTQAGIYVNAYNNWGRDLAVTCGYFKVETYSAGV